MKDETKAGEIQQELESYFRRLVEAYVQFPDDLKMELKRTRRGIALYVEPEVKDYSIVCGKGGRNFNALKLLLETIATEAGIVEADEDELVDLVLEGPDVDEEVARRRRPWADRVVIRGQLPYRYNPKWTPQMIKPLVVETLNRAGLKHVKVWMQKRGEGSGNVFNDQTFYWFADYKDQREEEVCSALGYLMESMGVVQGQKLILKRTEALEKAG
ncbi:MAG: hypothetical protein JO347_02075 [Candidatus Eremiobacteraeota bacterium]|nr:hypothetical protein [Candidatus Eremiobacteraeota bacterium]